MRNRKLIAAGAGIAVLALLSFALLGRQGTSASVNEEPKQQTEQSWLSKLSALRRPEMVTLPAGTKLHIRLQEGVSTDRNSSGDYFSATLDRPLEVNGKLLAPSRSQVVGQLTQVKESGRVKGRARLTMALRKLVIGGQEYELRSKPVTLVAPGTKKRDAVIIAGGAALGAAIGAIAGAGKGAAIGAGIGGGSGTGYVLATKGKPVAYGPESRFTFTLSDPIQLPVHRASG